MRFTHVLTVPPFLIFLFQFLLTEKLSYCFVFRFKKNRNTCNAKNYLVIFFLFFTYHFPWNRFVLLFLSFFLFFFSFFCFLFIIVLQKFPWDSYCSFNRSCMLVEWINSVQKKKKNLTENLKLLVSCMFFCKYIYHVLYLITFRSIRRFLNS